MKRSEKVKKELGGGQNALILHEVHFGMILSFIKRRRTSVRRVEIKGNRAQKERARREKTRAIPRCCLVTENYKCVSLSFLTLVHFALDDFVEAKPKSRHGGEGSGRTFMTKKARAFYSPG